MHQFLWIAIAWLGGIAAILGSLMTLGSLLLWIAPIKSTRSQKADEAFAQTTPPIWQGRLKITGFSVAIALGGLSLLIAVPFPQN
ncbi:hypothetical protein K9N68_22360 [Kovacikia minuta CCNUW1]|uniref:hypothetical protein n=1 Tax=Kovacikia minuta TaxID=2931930 RepID=UPI001CC9028B|nr:hypothetical protein [Kovacikia minuta]UBF24424.1 hypothetical protein K9N68_22360 [Kovacikia minuta CCNUW1]